jgi:hypothetical protein
MNLSLEQWAASLFTGSSVGALGRSARVTEYEMRYRWHQDGAAMDATRTKNDDDVNAQTGINTPAF